jgi:hypothetical protein
MTELERAIERLEAVEARVEKLEHPLKVYMPSECESEITIPMDVYNALWMIARSQGYVSVKELIDAKPVPSDKISVSRDDLEQWQVRLANNDCAWVQGAIVRALKEQEA